MAAKGMVSSAIPITAPPTENNVTTMGIKSISFPFNALTTLIMPAFMALVP